MSKKQTKQSRRTARRRARQEEALRLFKMMAVKFNWPRVPESFGLLTEREKQAVVRYAALCHLDPRGSKFLAGVRQA